MRGRVACGAWVWALVFGAWGCGGKPEGTGVAARAKGASQGVVFIGFDASPESPDVLGDRRGADAVVDRPHMLHDLRAREHLARRRRDVPTSPEPPRSTVARTLRGSGRATSRAAECSTT